ncbi:MAG: hypothetical protein AAGJ18_21335, partial [Bacteroidota bacterium]
VATSPAAAFFFVLVGLIFLLDLLIIIILRSQTSDHPNKLGLSEVRLGTLRSVGFLLNCW